MILAEYIRLSDKDEDSLNGVKDESDSVANQRALLRGYIKSHPDLCGAETLEFVDDGRSGTNFDRPGFQKMMDLARRGGIDCIIVKDCSRLGRNYIETGDYLEQVFPFLGIRFISVNDCYDSKDRKYGTAGDLDMGLRNLINDMYSRDLSQRIKLSKEQYAKRGEIIAAYPIFGYIKSPEDKRKLIIDEAAADCVRQIFRLALDGKSTSEIAGELNRLELPTPSQHKRELGVRRKIWSKVRNVSEWTAGMVRVVLREERYTGKQISLKATRYEVGNPNLRQVPKDDWIIVPGAFEPIISDEEFQRVQALHPVRTVSQKASLPPMLFHRKLHCGACGLALERRKTKKVLYRCPHCQRELWLSEEDISEAVMASLRQQLSFHALWEESQHEVSQELAQAEKRRDAEIDKLRLQTDRLRAGKYDAFVAYEAGRMDVQEYDTICRKNNEQIAALQGNIKALEAQRPKANMEVPVFENLLHSVSPSDSLTRTMVEQLISDIKVYPGGRIDVIWRFGDELQAALGKLNI